MARVFYWQEAGVARKSVLTTAEVRPAARQKRWAAQDKNEACGARAHDWKRTVGQPCSFPSGQPVMDQAASEPTRLRPSVFAR